MNLYPGRGISGSTLKIIAIVTMFIDHFGSAVVEKGILRLPMVRENASLLASWTAADQLMRTIGRLAFPIFCFLLIEGFIHTRSVAKYAARLFLFALLSELPFDLALRQSFYAPGTQNVFFTLLIGLLAIAGASWCRERRFFWLEPLVFLAGLFAADFLSTDYSYRGVFLIIILYLLRFSKPLQCLGGAIAIAWEAAGPLGFLPIWFYNGTRGKLSLKYFFYAFYPLHLLLFAGVRQLLLAVWG